VELVRRAARAAVHNTWSPVKAAVLEHVAARPLTIAGDRAAVSFTFDDVPLSAWENAVPLLAEHGVPATFYVALALADGGAFLGLEHVRALADAGHEVGSHTLTHYSLRHGTAEGLHRDALAGKRALEDALGRPVDHFSYPYAALTVAAKRRMDGAFATMRTSTRGVNEGRVDRGYLRAENLYSGASGLDLARVSRVLRRVEHGGWAIFYTHGVRDDPSPWDTSRVDFRSALELAVASGVPVVTVSEALARLEA
jgi:peptidoglycan/xylan/chitin deacetylase (PgdA/CDA1 family)